VLQQLQGMRPTENNKLPFHLIQARDDEEAVALRLLKAYGKPGATTLKPADCDFGPGGFAKLDVNKDGKLDVVELLKWQQRAPDLEFVIRLGKTQELTTELLQPGGKKPALANSVTKTSDGGTSLLLDDSQFTFGRPSNDNRGGNFVVALRGSLLQLYRSRVDPNKGHLVLKDLDSPQLQPLRQLFGLLDRDGDGKLTEKEVLAYLALESAATSSTLLLTIQDHGRNLFQLLDANRDGRLSLRELRTAWERLAPLDKNGDGVVSANELIRQFHFSATVGSPNNGRFLVAVPGMVQTPPTPTTTTGPLWFRKMDRYGIGDVSFRNFLGTRADFDRIDTDGDGLISVEEAIRFDELMRKQPNKR
jgi:Ca2+-binding EF-hand superfamily protein